MPSTLRLVLWPTAITFAVSVLRLVFELQGSVTTASGGRLVPLGITWLVLVFGAWFGWRLQRAGSAPRLRPAWAWSLLALLGLVATVVLNFVELDRGDSGESGYQQQRAAVWSIVSIAVLIGLSTFVIWTRLAWTLLVYAIPARLTVLLITWLAEDRGWDTHYTKFGPAGIDVDMRETMIAASVAQLGFWIPFTVVAGTLAGSVAAGLGRRDRPG